MPGRLALLPNTDIMKITTYFALLWLIPASTSAQIDIGGKVREKSKQKAENKTDETIDKSLDKIEEGIGNIFKKKEKKKGDAKKPSAVNTTGSKDKDISVYRGSAFVPGNDQLFFEDFTATRLGEGKTEWHVYEYDANDEVQRPSITSLPGQDGKWLKMPRKGFVYPNDFSNLPEQCTIEFDLYADPQRMSEHEGGFRTVLVARSDRDQYDIYFNDQPQAGIDVHPHGSSDMVNVTVKKEYNPATSGADAILFEEIFRNAWTPGAVHHVSIARSGSAIRIFLEGKELASLQDALPKKGNYQLLFATNLSGDGIYVSNVRIAATGKSATTEFKTTGKFITNAIYFDTGSAHIRPESWATLSEAAKAIKGETALIRITGHTDGDGAEDANLKLSQQRAESVKASLVAEFGIGADRLSTDGKGETLPIAPNTTADGRARNRRVEFTKTK